MTGGLVVACPLFLSISTGAESNRHRTLYWRLSLPIVVGLTLIKETGLSLIGASIHLQGVNPVGGSPGLLTAEANPNGGTVQYSFEAT